MKRLYTVTIETEIVVLADDRVEAEEIAQDLHDLHLGDMSYVASPMRHMPNDWDERSLVYGSDDDHQTLGSMIEAGAAPEYTALLERLRNANEGRRAGGGR